MFKKKNLPLLLIIVFFGIIYSLISFVNHYFFRTYALDLGIYNQSLYHYAHFGFANSTILKPEFGNILSDHLELLIPIISPLYYIFGTYTLLVVQVLASLFGGLGIYVFFKNRGCQKYVSIAAMLQYFLFFGVFSALSFDYHSNVIAAGLLPWFLIYFEKKKFYIASLFFLLILLSKENMAFWMFFVAIALFVIYFKDKLLRKYSGIFAALALLFFVLAINYIIPSLAPEGRRYQHFQFTALGTNFFEALTTIFTRPLYTLQLLFINHTGDLHGNYVKAEFYILFLLSGGIFLFFKPKYLIMIVPLIAQKMFNDFPETWGIGAHYNVEFAPIIAIAAFGFISEIKKLKIQMILVILIPVLTFAVSLKVFDNTICYVDHARIRMYQKMHYNRNFDVNDVYQLMDEIPENASVSTQNSFVPHLAFRDKIYAYPVVQDAEYLLLSPFETAYPLSENNFESRIDSTKISKYWQIISENKTAFLFKRKTAYLN